MTHQKHTRLVAGIALAIAAGGCAQPRPHAAPSRYTPAPLARPTRAIWVVRTHYRFEDDVRSIMRNCAELGFNTVLWQVRGEGTVAYPSRLEPWSREYNHADPGFDPLATAVAEAHRLGLRIEAWINVMPGWRGPQPPPVAEQLYRSHPDWFLCDASGQRQPLRDSYLVLNPCLPEVRRHIVRVCEEIATRYAVDGLHLDYVRFAWDQTPDAAARYPRDARTLELYRDDTGKRPDEDPQAWDDWRANQVTRLVGEIRVMLRQRRPTATLTAAVWRDPQVGYRRFLQNSIAWLRTGLVDAVMPMAYTDSDAAFVQDIRRFQALAPRKRIIPGIGAYKHRAANALRLQLRQCQHWGGDFAFFSYDSLHVTAADRTREVPDAAANSLRRMRRETLSDFPASRAARRAAPAAK